MINLPDIEAMITAMPDVVKDYPFDETTAVYKIGSLEGKMFALVSENISPVRLSLKCDPQLAELLREKYETVLQGYHLNKKHWNTIICSGQVPVDELADLIRHSYELVVASSDKVRG